MVMPTGHAREAAELVPLPRRDRRVIAVVLGLVAIAAVVVVAFAAGGGGARAGCLHVDLPGTMGANELRPCGGAAVGLCRSATAPPLAATRDGATIRGACRRAGIRS